MKLELAPPEQSEMHAAVPPVPPTDDPLPEALLEEAHRPREHVLPGVPLS